MHAETRGAVSDETAVKALDACSHMLAQRFDAERGGFGTAPKFPRPAEINALLTDHIRCSDSRDVPLDDGAPPPPPPPPSRTPTPEIYRSTGRRAS